MGKIFAFPLLINTATIFMNQEVKPIEELLADESFLKYCEGDEKEKRQWEERLRENPVLKEQVAQAKRLYALVKAELADVNSETEKFSSLLQQHIAVTGGSGEEAKVIVMRERRRRWMWAAAAVVFLLGAGLYFLLPQKAKAPDQVVMNDIKAPDVTKATVTLANGERIYLDSVGNGALATQGNMNLVKTGNGEITYQPVLNGTEGKLQYNSLQNPRGSKVINIVLSDGTKVWLNAGSSLTYPVAFVEKERKVAITGEAYFEVKHNASSPFKVTVNEMQVTVLGTHFNINSYADDGNIETTLLEGSVNVKSRNAAQMLSPGQQAVFNKTGLSLEKNVDVAEVMAWKNGFFNFNNASLKQVMQQLMRWYDVEVEYSGSIPPVQFVGEIERGLNLSQVLNILEKNGVYFKIEGKKLTVMPSLKQ